MVEDCEEGNRTHDTFTRSPSAPSRARWMVVVIDVSRRIGPDTTPDTPEYEHGVLCSAGHLISRSNFVARTHG